MANEPPTSAHTTPLATVLAWHDAANRKDCPGAAELCATDILMNGPQGELRGLHVMRDWVCRSGKWLVPARTWTSGSRVAVEQEIARPDTPDTDPGPHGPHRAGAVFEVIGGRITACARYSDVSEALAAAGIADGTPPDATEARSTPRPARP
ncbi:nuclear transport factor 2 family protein [Nocardiopsis sediminis]|uniref:Nuclear transport factor 2 family protein n=1 Tax=Nocardiopsis sediminis TaxID=1778267 RepID=A0ABV8FIP1_9ACTN